MQNLKASFLFALNLLSLDSLINVLPDRKKYYAKGTLKQSISTKSLFSSKEMTSSKHGRLSMIFTNSLQ